jgi:aconitate hydratase
MGPEYGATIGYFPMDGVTLDYLRTTGRPEEQVKYIEQYLKLNQLFREGTDPEYSGDIMELDLSTVKACVSGPKRPHDRVPVDEMKSDFTGCLTNPVGFKGFGLERTDETASFNLDGQEYTLKNGSVVMAAITSCTNTSNPEVMIGAGLLAKKAVAAGLKV